MATPTLDEFLSAARADNPGVSDGQLASYWLKTYAGGKGELPKSEATAGGLIRSFGSSAIDTVGSAFQGGGANLNFPGLGFLLHRAGATVFTQKQAGTGDITQRGVVAVFVGEGRGQMAQVDGADVLGP